MRRGLTLACLALALLAPAQADAQTRERVKITGIRLGLPVGPLRADASRTSVFKAGQWAPVYVDLECVRDTEEPLLLVVETFDADETITEGSVEIAAMAKGDRLLGNELGRLPYLKPGMMHSAVTVRVKGAQSGRNYGELRERFMEALGGNPYVILGVGANLNGLRFSSGDRKENDDGIAAGRAARGGWIESAQILDVGLLPDQWFGYSAVDLMILGTGADRTFWETLSAPQHEKRRKAIAEWVRRGGRVVLSVGTNPDVLEAVKEIRDLLPATVPPGGKRSVQSLPFNWLPATSGVTNNRTGKLGFPGEKSDFAVATLQARTDRPVRTLLEGEPGTPLAIQGPHGLGRVTVVAFDLDRAPFSDWRTGRAGFWENLFNQAGYQLPASDSKFETYGSRLDEYNLALQGSLDYFEGVPVVSFGWVALFILIYIILIGPVDYLFLKKVVKRLEWTWVTFPIIVITVSAGAYFAAYALKGKDLKTNKVDVVDIDLTGRRIEGHTWFTLFSPRIQNYTIGLEPAGALDQDPSRPAWTPANPSVAARDTLLSWQSNVERSYGGGGGGFFSKKYRYQSTVDPLDPNRDLYAAGLEGVPIQVWTTKAFAAQWSAPIDPARPPIFADLSVSRSDNKVLVGTITNQLPVDRFTDMALVWRSKVYPLADFPTGVPKAISFSADQGGGNTDLKNWVATPERYGPGETPHTPINRNEYQFRGSSTPGTPTNPAFRLWPVLFHDLAPDNRYGTTPNASLRRLDQSWRVAPNSPEQAILVLRVATREAAAEEMARSPESPSRLWLGELPTSGTPRPAIQGTLKQETYIRVFIPVKAGKK